jgi:hypothetical protein
VDIIARHSPLQWQGAKVLRIIGILCNRGKLKNRKGMFLYYGNSREFT